MTRPIIRIHDLELNEVIDREMTVAEFKVYQTELENNAAKELAVQTKEAERQAILDRLGLTADEAKLILG